MSETVLSTLRVPNLGRVEHFCRSLAHPIAMVGVIGMLIVAGVTVVDVAGRWLFNAPLPAMNEVVAMTFAVAVAACLPSSIAHHGQLRVDLISALVSKRANQLLLALGSLLLLAFLSLLTWRLYLYSADAMESGRFTAILHWRVGPFMYGMTAMIAIGIVIQLVITLNQFAKWANFDPEAPVGDQGMESSSRAATLGVALVYVSAAALVAITVYDFSTLERWAQEHPILVMAIGFAALWALLLSLVPLGAAMGLTGLMGAALFITFEPALSVMAQEPVGIATNVNIAVLPLFLMMGSFAAVAGIADDAYVLGHALLGRFRGGLAMATIGGCAGFGAVTGSSVATAATIGRVALPEMKARGYSPALSTGCVAGGGTLGNFVPPGSGPLVLFALLTEASIGQLFIASVLPAVLVVLAFLITVAVFVRVHPDAAPPAGHSEPGELSRALKRSGPLLSLFTAVLGGLYTGVFTGTEAAAVGAIGAFAVAAFRKKLRPSEFFAVMSETTQVTGMVYGLIFGAVMFAFFSDITGVAEQSMRYVSSIELSPIVLIVVLLVFFVGLGTFMDAYAVMIVTIPIVTPLILAAGYDIVWWGIINLFVIEIGAISPPFGLNMFVLKGIQDAPLTTIYYGATWFCLAAILVLALLVAFPSISMWLPSTMIS